MLCKASRRNEGEKRKLKKDHTHTYQLQHILIFWHYRELQNVFTAETQIDMHQRTNKRSTICYLTNGM